LAPKVTELIQGYVVAMNLETTEEELMHTIFRHPSLSDDEGSGAGCHGRVLICEAYPRDHAHKKTRDHNP